LSVLFWIYNSVDEISISPFFRSTKYFDGHFQEPDSVSFVHLYQYKARANQGKLFHQFK